MADGGMGSGMVAPRPIEWTPASVQRFWEYWSGRADLEECYFARQAGGAVVDFLSTFVPLAGAAVLDLGSGPGYLIDRLLERGARVHAADLSEQSIAKVQTRLAGREGWQGAKRMDGPVIPWPDGVFDVVCCLETIEHLTAEQCGATLAEARRVLRPEGTLLVTTPNEEPLEASHTLCPNCGSIYHRMQHLRSWSAGDLLAALEDAGFGVRFCRGLNFMAPTRPPRPTWYTASLRDVVQWIRACARVLSPRQAAGRAENARVAAMLASNAPVHLAAVATRAAG
jgi:2-polyprenyl-3-methyl-5-hydroxy-6-metoxy-1,4-benzoquinol methylase